MKAKLTIWPNSAELTSNAGYGGSDSIRNGLPGREAKDAIGYLVWMAILSGCRTIEIERIEEPR